MSGTSCAHPAKIPSPAANKTPRRESTKRLHGEEKSGLDDRGVELGIDEVSFSGATTGVGRKVGSLNAFGSIFLGSGFVFVSLLSSLILGDPNGRDRCHTFLQAFRQKLGFARR